MGITKRLVAFLLATALMLTCLPVAPVSVEAADVVNSGTCGDNLTWTLDSEGLLTISGTGDMWNWGIVNTSSDSPWAYNTNIKSVVIGDDVTSVGGVAFWNCTGLVEVTIGAKVKSIGGYSFCGCTNLTNVVIPNDVKTIEGVAFGDCTNLSFVTIGDNVTSIEYGAFSNCSNLKSMTIPESVTSIGDSAFAGCNSLTDVYYTGTQDQWNAISISSGNTDLTSVAIHYGGEEPTEPEGTTAPTEATEPGADESLFIYEIANGQATITDCDESISGDITIPATLGGYPVTRIGYDAFSWCPSLESIAIPDGVTGIGDCAFWYCTNLESIMIPDGVTSIGYGAFGGCSSLTSMIIPDSVTSIGDRAFDACTSLTGIWVDENNTNYSSDAVGVLFNKDKTVLLQAPGRLSGAYEIPDSVTSIGDNAFYACGSLTSITIPEGVASIGHSVFSYCTSLMLITIPDSVTSIGGWAFRKCDSLTDITIPDSVTSIGDYAFADCNSLADVYYTGTQDQWKAISIGEGNESLINTTIYYGQEAPTEPETEPTEPGVGESLFSYEVSNGEATITGCDSAIGVDVTIPATLGGYPVTSIGDYAFYYCNNLTSITIPDGVTSIGDDAFDGCTSLTDVYYGGTAAQWAEITVGSYNEALINARIHYTEPAVPEIIESGTCGDNLTWTLDNAGTLTISGTGDMKDYNHFDSISPWYDYRDQIKTVVIESGVTNIGDYAFYDCSNLTSITISEGVTRIGWNTFCACSALTCIDVPDSVIVFGNGAFQGCSGLTSITIPEGVISIGNFSFSYCTGLEEINYNAVCAEDAIDWNTIFFGAGESSNGITLNIGKNVLRIPAYLFKYSLEVDTNKFSGPKIKQINFADDCRCESFGEGAFFENISLGEIVIPDSVTGIKPRVFQGCTNLTSVTVPDGMTSIGDYAFQNCSGLTSITIPDSVTDIGVRAFHNCSSLISATIGNGVTSIVAGAFYNCTSLTSVTIGNSVTSIGEYAFCWLGGLTDVYYNGTEEQWNSIAIESGNDELLSATIHYEWKDVAEPTNPGDMNGDGEVSDADALYLLRFTLFPERYPLN